MPHRTQHPPFVAIQRVRIGRHLKATDARVEGEAGPRLGSGRQPATQGSAGGVGPIQARQWAGVA
jgi:hypothetical protein